MTGTASCGDLATLHAQLTRLLNDIRELRVKTAPAPIHLEEAPLVDQWSIGLIPVPCIVGTMVGCPIFRNQPRIHTQQAVLIDPKAGWARTWSGFYRLGTRQVLESGDE
ncbi:DUF6634 family protein [Bradyrhizobium sp. USDA 10063]